MWRSQVRGTAESNTGMQEARDTGDEVRDQAVPTQPLLWRCTLGDGTAQCSAGLSRMYIQHPRMSSYNSPTS